MQHSREMIYLKDYKPTAFTTEHIDLEFDLFPDYTDVYSKMTIKRRAGSRADEPLVLDGRKLEFQSLLINGKSAKKDEYEVNENKLTLLNPPDAFTLEVHNRIRPHLNTALEGLYMSQGMYCTQCEATGFRSITYFYDRPDVMLTFKVKITANKELYPSLLSNGNFVDKGDLSNGRHWTLWEDPFPKPCYLFALVAGKLALQEDYFTTASGRKVRLAIYADKKDIDKCTFAMQSLKQAFKWDEEAYGRECDLDDYKVVSARDFNMGAMENKGLNIFNSSLILASQQTATDQAFQRIASVIGHEYFHNWTGNRITCRDWFQLCLKEGLTVFRDQEFSESIGSPAVERIDSVNFLRSIQFPEDDGPTSHPPRPDKFIEINNFYTVTVYEKGAEVVRVLKTLLGPQMFRKGMDLYFERHDGQAVTQEDFVQAFADVSGRDLSQFMLWYTQAGAPHVEVEDIYNEQDQTYMLRFTQTVPPTPGEETKKPFHIPVTLSLFQSSGKPFELFKDEKTQSFGDECTLELRKETETFTFRNIKTRPIPSLFRNFSAPIRLKTERPNQELFFLMKHDTDPFNAWDAGQKLMLNELLQIVKNIQSDKAAHVSREWSETFGYFLSKKQSDKAFQAKMISLPSFEIVAQKMSVIDPEAIIKAEHVLKYELAKNHEKVLMGLYKDNVENGHFSIETDAIGKRLLKNVCLSYLSTLETDEVLDKVLNQYHNANNMTDRLSALSLLSHWDTAERGRIFDHFYKTWKEDDLVIDDWFMLQARSRLSGTFEQVIELVQHPAFNLQNPNRLRSLIFSFCKNNPLHFHDKSGHGYAFCADKVMEIDRFNRQMAAGLVRSFNSWKRYDTERQSKIRVQLERIKRNPSISSDVFELVTQILN